MKSIQVLRKLESETNLQIRENVSDWIKEIKNTARGICTLHDVNMFLNFEQMNLAIILLSLYTYYFKILFS